MENIYIKFSIVIPVYNERESIINLINEILEVVKNYNYEIIVVDDCSKDDTFKIVKKYSENYKINLKILNLNQNMGQSYAIAFGVKNSNSDNIITIDGDGQNNPIDIINLLKEYQNSSFSLIGGIRKKRKDNLVKKISSKIANSIRKLILNDDCDDTGCSLKIFKKNVYLEFPYFKGSHRFLPALFKGYGYKTKFINVDHRFRRYGKSKYGTLNRLFIGIRDLIKVVNLINNVSKKK